MAHELMHALLRTTDHHLGYGLAAPLREGDLEVESRLQPEEAAALQQAIRARKTSAERGDPS